MMLEKATKEFRDLLMTCDEVHIMLEPRKDFAVITFRKSIKVPGFGTQVAEKVFSTRLIARYPENSRSCSLYVPASVARAVFYALSYGDKISLYLDKIEKDRHVYMVFLTAIRDYKGKDPLTITLPLGVAKGK